MASVTITGREPGPDGTPREDFVPKRAQYSVYSIPEETCITEGECEAGGLIQLDLSPGKYRIKVRKHRMAEGKAEFICNWERFFYVGMDEKIWKRVRFMRPRWIELMHTTKGPRYKCTLPGCSEYNTGKWGALLHEMRDHFNLDPMTATYEDLDRGAAPAPAAQKLPDYEMPTMALSEDEERKAKAKRRARKVDQSVQADAVAAR